MFVILVVAPLFGVLVDRTLARNLEEASLVSPPVVTIGLLLILMGLAINLWPPRASHRRVLRPGRLRPRPDHRHLARAHDGCHRGAVALGLRLIMFQTRGGVTMRAVVDHRGLATWSGPDPARSSMLSWALGSSLAAVAGILLAPCSSSTCRPSRSSAW